MSNQRVNSLLKQGISQLGISLQDHQYLQLINYLKLIQEWNKTHNLTAIDNMEDMVTKHLLDSLSIYKYVDTSPILDVGTGAGLPTIPLAIAKPELQFTALDINRKRITFIKHCLRTLNISNVVPVCERVENFKAEPFALICSRAFSSLSQFVGSTRHLIASEGKWLAMKGRTPVEEKSDLTEDIALTQESSLQVPGLQADRCIIILEPIGQPGLAVYD